MSRILIANRGEIAVRILRACAQHGHTSVAVYADQDADAMHARLADEAFALPGTTAGDTYLNIDAILSAAKAAGADAVHPGYGFLSENADFAAAVEGAGLIWIGPTADTITALGDKVTARQLAQKVGAPLAPGIDRPLENAAEVESFAAEAGLPIIIKAAHGGGGRGMKIVHELTEVAGAFESATREAVEAFGRPECFVEKFLERPRHVEVQIVGDGQGRVVAVGDRDCSAQRRNQKLIEEAPAPGLTDEQRERLHRSAEAICAEVDYRGAGTVEFLLAADGTMTFLEVNTRLQVEHPVTEVTSGVDLVAEQFRIAFGQGLSLESTPQPVGHAIELRINAEDPGRGFLPTPGRIDVLDVPGGLGVRWDSGVRAGDTVQPAFDSLFAKLIVHGPDRGQAIARTLTAAKELRVDGVATVLPCSLAILGDEAFTGLGEAGVAGIHTQWIESELLPRFETQERPAPVADVELQRMSIEIDGKLTTIGLPAGLLAALGSARGGNADQDRDGSSAGNGGAASASAGDVSAPVPGSLVDFLVDDGAEVAAGDEVAVLSAMKMETRVEAPVAGTLRQVAAIGDAVSVGQTIARVE
ncbi:acetyl-CoA/propionyl-CoA carboxylase, biotin carboxylase, biotin carboxyl carrier protein [Brevibacterium iodinum ATCC 49514]|uniref:biotin carboxylase n=1 Tax=Brevibacterium iodinum ATCC 49514 TaxID=1255616 RepID=A0A2H1JXQ7_9MICO|nr:biotin carboxylase N-terminal domain-containing protein [Brevibacterium iodinum]SMX92243.1 acetyl-CoA/propionyl-CoA carboxylase, biotin carboxylase, biotin carboxyl carrier protein [Brevibacterium iodinum ATCC 49514]SUW13193.1 Biotin carboxylase [Brevibacterium iodinum]